MTSGDCNWDKCCKPDRFATDTIDIQGSEWVGLLCIAVGLLTFVIENEDFGYGLWQPNDWMWYENKVSPLGLFYLIAGACMFVAWPAAFAGVCYVCTFACMMASHHYQEAGDGGRERRAGFKKKAQEARAKAIERGEQTQGPLADVFDTAYAVLCEWTVLPYILDAVKKDQLATIVWLILFFAVNLFQFAYSLSIWVDLTNSVSVALINGDLDIDCDDANNEAALAECEANEKIVVNGWLSNAAPWAKACGACLNLNCALIVMPVTKLLLARLNNAGLVYSK